MKIGFPNHPRKDLVNEIEWIGRNGFDFIDLFLEEDRAVPDRIDIDGVRKALEKHSLDAVGHMAWYLPIGSPSEVIREAAVTEVERYLKAFSELNVQYVTVHANWPPGLFSVNEGIRFQVHALKKLLNTAGEFNINLMYEPIDTKHDDIASVAEILKRIPSMFLHIDLGHANLFGRNPEEFIRKFHGKLKHIHLHDNDGLKDQHLPMGTGRVDWESLLRVLKTHYDGTITLEVFSQDRDFVLLSKDKLRRMWANTSTSR